MGDMGGPFGRVAAPRPFVKTGLAMVVLGTVLFAAALAAAEEQCDAASGDANCLGAPSPKTEKPVDVRLPAEDLGFARLAVVVGLLGSVVAWILATLKFAWDGSLPARLAMWGLLPEAYAAISVRAVVALLRLKSGPTPIVVLRNCVTDAGAAELAQGLIDYGKKAELQALELPHNPAFGAEGLRSLAAAVPSEGLILLEELDFSYNPQLGEAAAEILHPLLVAKSSKITTLRLADCGLGLKAIQKLGDRAECMNLRLLDLSCNALAGAGEALAELLEAPVLEELVLNCCGLQKAEMAALCEQLPYTSLKSLQLGGNRFGSAGLGELLRFLAKSQVDELGLEGNDIEAKDLDALGTEWVKRPFSRVRLNGNRMTPAEIARFINTLKSTQTM